MKHERRIREIVREEILKINRDTETALGLVCSVFGNEENVEKQEPNSCWVSMDRNKQITAWLRRTPPLWHQENGVWHGDNCMLEIIDYIPGLQPGMLCKVKRIRGTGRFPDKTFPPDTCKITEVVECNLPIEVERRWCKFLHNDLSNDKPPECIAEQCPLGRFRSYITCESNPYLPGTDVLITCEFEERKHEEKVEEKSGGYFRCPSCGGIIGTIYALDHLKQPKLITLDLLKERGACKEGLEWFEEKMISHKDTTLQNLLRCLGAYGKSEWVEWVVKNLWDLA